MGMVVSAAVTGIPIIEQLENARPIQGSRKPTGGKAGAKKGGSISTTTTANQKQTKGKPKGLDPLVGKEGTPKESKTAISKSGSTSKTKGKGPTGTAKGGVKIAPDKADTGKTVEKGVGRGGKEASVPSKGGAKGRGKGKQ